MAKAGKPKGEAAQYLPLENWLRTKGECTETWRVGQKPNIKIKVPGKYARTPDVVGVRQTASGWDVLLVEAKNPKGGHALNVGIAQLEALRPWADFLILGLDPIP